MQKGERAHWKPIEGTAMRPTKVPPYMANMPSRMDLVEVYGEGELIFSRSNSTFGTMWEKASFQK